MSAKDSTLTSSSIRRSAWAEQLLGDAQSDSTAAATKPASHDAEAQARSQQFFAQVLRNLDRLEKLAAKGNGGGEEHEAYEWSQLIDPTGNATMAPRLARAKTPPRTVPIVALNVTSLALLAVSAVSQNWWPLPAAAFVAAAAALLYLRGCRVSWRLSAR